MQRLIMANEFVDQNQRTERNNKLISFGITVIIHAIIIIIFIYLFGFSRPNPPLTDTGGVELNIGNTDMGLGDEQVQGVPISTNTDVQSASSPKINSPAPNVITQSVEQTAVINQNQTTNTNNTQTNTNTNQTTINNNTTTTTPTPKPDPKPKYNFGSSTHGSTTQGNTKPGGDQGNPNGTPNGTSYSGTPGIGNNPTGTGNGNGPSLSMTGGRQITKFPMISDKTQRDGVVNVLIKVDRQGHVIFAQATQKDSTTPDAYLWDLAEKAAMQTLVTPDPNAPEEQFGFLKFTFKLK